MTPKNYILLIRLSLKQDRGLSVAKITFVVAEITLKVAVITFSVDKITFVVAKI